MLQKVARIKKIMCRNKIINNTVIAHNCTWVSWGQSYKIYSQRLYYLKSKTLNLCINRFFYFHNLIWRNTVHYEIWDKLSLLKDKLYFIGLTPGHNKVVTKK